MARLKTQAVPRGTIFFERFRVIKLLGKGGSGAVYLCRHLKYSAGYTALKLLRKSKDIDENVIKRFRSEMKFSCRVFNSHVVRAFGCYEDDEYLGFTMEYVASGTLADQVNETQPMDISRIVSILSQMSLGLKAIHDQGIIHRDLKPENIFLDPWNTVKIGDLGIAVNKASVCDEPQEGISGTLNYVSPEYVERGQLDERSDIYALGVIAYELITGQLPFKGKTPIETLTMRVYRNPEAAQLLRTDCPAELSELTLRAMARNPEERFQSIDKLMQALETIGEEKRAVQLRFHRRVPRPVLSFPVIIRRAGTELTVLALTLLSTILTKIGA